MLIFRACDDGTKARFIWGGPQLAGRLSLLVANLCFRPGTHHVELHFDAIELYLRRRFVAVSAGQRRFGMARRRCSRSRDLHHIPSGRMPLHLRACNRDGIWDRVGIIYNITQQPYFYETRLFVAGYVTTGLLLLGGLYRLRLHQATARQTPGWKSGTRIAPASRGTARYSTTSFMDCCFASRRLEPASDAPR